MHYEIRTFSTANRRFFSVSPRQQLFMRQTGRRFAPLLHPFVCRCLIRFGAWEEAKNVLDEDIPHDLDDDFRDDQPNYNPFQLRVMLVRKLLTQHVQPKLSSTTDQVRSTSYLFSTPRILKSNLTILEECRGECSGFARGCPHRDTASSFCREARTRRLPRRNLVHRAYPNSGSRRFAT